jgi:hypothetical protein
LDSTYFPDEPHERKVVMAEEIQMDNFDPSDLLSVESWVISQMVSIDADGVTSSLVILLRVEGQDEDDPPFSFVLTPREGLKFGADIILVGANE